MDFSFKTFVDMSVSFFLKMLDLVGQMNSKAAFVIGALVWLVIEISVRKLSNTIRMLIIVAIITSSSIAALKLF